MVKLSLAEKREQFLILLGLFIFATAILASVLFYTESNQFIISKEDLANRIKDDQNFETASAQAISYVDSAANQINKFDPTIQAVFIENDIKKILRDINAVYVRNDFDNRYSIFAQGALLYDNYFVDKRELKGNLSDIERIQKSLDDCLVNRRQIQQSMSMLR